MAQTLSSYVTNEASATFAINAAGQANAHLFTTMGTVEVPDTANGDSLMLCKLPVDANIISLKVATDDLGTAGTMDVGLWKANADGVFTAVDDDAFAVALDVNAAAVALTERRFTALDINTAALPLWNLATGLSARPAYEHLYLGIITDTGTTAVGTLTFQVLYTV